MSPHRKCKVDGNHAEIVKALRQIGASVQNLSAVGKGCPDLLVGYRYENYLLEVKDGSKPASARKLTKDQLEWHNKWAGDVHIVNSVEEAINVVQPY